MKSFNLSGRKRSSSFGVSLWELAVVIAILVVLAFFIMRSCAKGGSSSSAGVLGRTTVGLAKEAVKLASTNYTIHMSPSSDCRYARDLANDVATAQAKIDAAARDYPSDYAANKDALQRDVDILNQNIEAYNHDCPGANIPKITLPR